MVDEVREEWMHPVERVGSPACMQQQTHADPVRQGKARVRRGRRSARGKGKLL